MVDIPNLWEISWVYAMDLLGNPKLIMMMVIPIILVYYWTIAGLYLIFDCTQWPGFISRYKIQPDTNNPVNTDDLLKVVKVVLINQLIVNTIVITLVVFILDELHVLETIDFKAVPTFPKLMLELVACGVFYEIVFYYSHRFFLHHKLVYKHVHKMHHQWTAPIAAASQYAHPIEHLISILSTSGFAVFRTEMSTALISILFLTTTSLIEHGGLHLPFLQSPELHDYHHYKFTECFGTNGIMDQLHGTSKTFVGTGVINRHRTLIGFKATVETVTPAKDSQSSKKKENSRDLIGVIDQSSTTKLQLNDDKITQVDMTNVYM